MQAESTTNLLLKIRELEEQLSEANQIDQAVFREVKRTFPEFFDQYQIGVIAAL